MYYNSCKKNLQCTRTKTKEHLSSFLNNNYLISLQGVFWRSQLYIDQPLFLKFNISLEKDALVGVYGRKGLPPSHTQVGSKKGARLELQVLSISEVQSRSKLQHRPGLVDVLLLDMLEDEPTEYTRIKNPVTGHWGTCPLAHSSLSLFSNELLGQKEPRMDRKWHQIQRLSQISRGSTELNCFHKGLLLLR